MGSLNDSYLSISINPLATKAAGLAVWNSPYKEVVEPRTIAHRYDDL